MNFKEKFNEYIMELGGCTTKALSEASGLSAAVISRYRSGERTPGIGSEQLVKLSKGIAELSEKTENSKTAEEVLSEFRNIMGTGINSGAFCAKVDYIITELNINVSALSKVLNYDASFISRIRAGNRLPSDMSVFAHKFAFYIVKTYSGAEISKILSGYFKEIPADLTDTEQQIKRLEEFILTDFSNPPTQAESFLRKLDDFDLNEYIRSVHFDELKVPAVPFRFHTQKEYFGVEGQRKSEIDFLKGAVLAKSTETVFMCSDMDMADMAEDLEFSKQWMFGLAMLLKRNMHINIVHNLNRPFSELMLGLEAWIPLYMTGLVKPYYLKGAHDNLYQHMLYTSGTFALSGECIKGFHNRGRYILTNNKDNVSYYRERAKCILKKAGSLMDIYTADDVKQFYDFYSSSSSVNGNRHYISSSLPTFTFEDDILADILRKNGLNESDCGRMLAKNRERRVMLKVILEKNKILHEVPLISKEEFEEHPLVLDFSEYGCYEPVLYDYGDYLKHMEACGKFAEENENYIFRPNSAFSFRNIQIRILEGKWVWITKIKSPMIHFVIHHPLLRDAIEKMYVPIHD